MTRWAARLLLGLLVVLTSTGLVTSTAQTARADAVDEIVKVAAGVGTVGVRASPAIATGLGATVCATGVGCVVIGAAALGIAAYATRDYWLPWVSNQLAQLGVLSSWGADPGGTLTWVSEPALDGTAHPPLTIRGAYKGVGDGFHYTTVYTEATCKNITTGVVRSTGSYQQPDKLFQASGGYIGMFGATNPTDGTFYGCADDESMLGVVVRADLETANVPAGTPFREVPSAWNSLALGRLLDDVNNGAYTSSVNCKRPDGSNYAVTRTSTPATGILGAVKIGSCDAGDTMTGGNISTAGTVVSQWTMPTEAEVSALYPNCVGANEGNCTYVIKINGEPCASSILACQGWTQTNITNPGTVSCWYGPYQLELAACGWLERAYEPDGAPATEKNIDGNPDTWESPRPSWQTQPTPTATGTPTVTTSPSPTGTASPTGSPTPTATGTASPTVTATGGTVPDPSTWPGAAGSPQPGSAGSECFPTGWGIFNPVEWVYRPVMCALDKAFRPNDALVQARTAELQAKLGQVGVVPIIDAVGDNFDLASGAGCGGLPVNFTLAGAQISFQMFESCSGPMATLAGYSRAISSVVIAVGGGLAFIRALSAGFGFNFSMGSRGTES